ncbi:MAG: tetratricopeptide repeat protein, partial [Pseudanabaenaceae cyanobacterium]
PKTTAPPPQVQIHVKNAPPRPVVPPEERLKQEMVRKIEELLRQKKYVVAIPIAEGLQARFPDAPDLARLLAIVYYRHGSECLIAPKSRLREAETYLSKALATDPKNRELKFEIERDLERLQRLKQIEQDLAGLQRHRNSEAS